MSDITSNLRPSTTAGRVPNALQTTTKHTDAPQNNDQNPISARQRLDQVELSDRALVLSKIAQSPEIRTDLVTKIRAQIEAGDYLNSDNLSKAADNLINDFEILG